MAEIKLGRVPFKEAIEYFKGKDRLATKAYTDIQHEIHDRAFVIAGVEKDDILLDVKGLLTKAMEDGTPFEQWQKEFAKAIDGRWLPTSKTGEPNTGWRGRIIYDTNMATAYAAGEYKQRMELRDLLPFWRYRHGDSLKPRMEHLAWDGLVLRWDDPWWDTHCPPNGYGCTCYVESLDEADLEDLKARGLRKSDKPDEAPPSPTRKVKFGDAELEVPKGIDPGWAYAPGKETAIWPPASPKGKASIAAGEGLWEPFGHPLDKMTAKDHGRPDALAPRPTRTGKPLIQEMGIPGAIKEILGMGADDCQKTFRAKCGHWQRDIVVDANRLGGHIGGDQGKLQYLEYLPDALQPQEVWAQFLKHKRSGKVALRWKLVSFVKKEGRVVMLVCEANSQGVLEAYTFVPASDPKYINNKIRAGRLVAWE